jgi:extracellular factor (EF) 3-hydroxypalmitic acid methyl ester biosynthesis protein
MMSEYLYQTHLSNGYELLDTTERCLREERDIEDALWRLNAGLRSIRRSTSETTWKDFIQSCLNHPLREILHQDPYTFHSFSKPRGYSGDAELIDYLYRISPDSNQLKHVSSIGQDIVHLISGAPSGCAVRHRRDLLAHLIDQVATEVNAPEILSIACGHAREFLRSEAATSGKLGRFLAIDQDVQSLEVVEHELKTFGAEPLELSIVDMIRGRIKIDDFDCIYVSGLYDYLPTRMAKRLTHFLFGHLKPSGRLLIANFVPHIFEVGYMEAFMDWHLIYRTPQELKELARSLSPDEVTKSHVWLEDGGNIGYLMMQRNSSMPSEKMH